MRMSTTDLRTGRDEKKLIPPPSRTGKKSQIRMIAAKILIQIPKLELPRGDDAPELPPTKKIAQRLPPCLPLSQQSTWLTWMAQANSPSPQHPLHSSLPPWELEVGISLRLSPRRVVEVEAVVVPHLLPSHLLVANLLSQRHLFAQLSLHTKRSGMHSSHLRLPR